MWRSWRWEPSWAASPMLRCGHWWAGVEANADHSSEGLDTDATLPLGVATLLSPGGGRAGAWLDRRHRDEYGGGAARDPAWPRDRHCAGARTRPGECQRSWLGGAGVHRRYTAERRPAYAQALVADDRQRPHSCQCPRRCAPRHPGLAAGRAPPDADWRPDGTDHWGRGGAWGRRARVHHRDLGHRALFDLADRRNARD